MAPRFRPGWVCESQNSDSVTVRIACELELVRTLTKSLVGAQDGLELTVRMVCGLKLTACENAGKGECRNYRVHKACEFLGGKNRDFFAFAT